MLKLISCSEEETRDDSESGDNSEIKIASVVGSVKPGLHHDNGGEVSNVRNVHKMSFKDYQTQLKKPPAPNAPDYLAPDVNLPKPPKTDIQDKTNKRCSSCQITFDSRSDVTQLTDKIVVTEE